MTRFVIHLPDIDYGQSLTSTYVQYPVINNQLTHLPEKFYRWTTHKDQPFHCFVDDWRIEAIWRDRYKMVDRAILSQFACLPDYTIETDAPLIHAIHQVWRSRTIGRFWQDHGVFCIPTLQWSRPEINPHLFVGLDQCDIVAVRSPSSGSETEWLHCANQFLHIHRPKLVLHFGTKRGIHVWPNAINLNLK